MDIIREQNCSPGISNHAGQKSTVWSVLQLTTPMCLRSDITSNVEWNVSEDDKLPCMQKAIFNYTFIFDEHELQRLLHNHKSMIYQLGFKTSRVKSSYIKDILTREFGGKIGFHLRPQRNHSDLVYYMCGVAHLLNQHSLPLGVRLEQMMCNIVGWLRDYWLHKNGHCPMTTEGRAARYERGRVLTVRDREMQFNTIQEHHHAWQESMINTSL